MKIKRTLEIYATYGKGDGEELDESFDISDIKTSDEFIEKCFEDYAIGDYYTKWTREDLVQLFEVNDEYVYRAHHDDWDSPTGFHATIVEESIPETYEEHLALTLINYRQELVKLYGKFPEKELAGRIEIIEVEPEGLPDFPELGLKDD